MKAEAFGAARRRLVMASNAALMIEWGMPRQGRERKALEEFFAHMQWWAEIKSKGEIADFRIYGDISGNIEQRAGFVVFEGTSQQIEKLRTSEAFRTRLNRVFLVGENLKLTLLEMGDDMSTRMQRYAAALKEIGI
jgi:hypothetical protein